jgi:hypothetical protein
MENIYLKKNSELLNVHERSNRSERITCISFEGDFIINSVIQLFEGHAYLSTKACAIIVEFPFSSKRVMPSG